MISGYIGNTLIYMAITAAVYLPCRILFVKRKGRRAPLWREACLMLFWMLVVGIVSQTVFPRILIGITDGGEWHFNAYVPPRTAPNFIPLRTIWLFWEHRADSSDWEAISLLNLAGNVLLFVPVGVLFPFAYPKCDRFKSIFLWSLGGVVCIETLQYFFGRVADIVQVAKLGQIFTPVVKDISDRSAHIYKLTEGGKTYIAVFNFSKPPRTFTVETGLSAFTGTELWTGEAYSGQNTLEVRLRGGDAALFEIEPA